MKILIVLFSLGVACASFIPEDVATSNYTGVFGYHMRIGVPKFQQIKEQEEALLKSGSRITGGSTTLSATAPYQAGLIISLPWLRTSICSGCLISDNTVLAAAHCQNDGQSIAQSTTIVLGSALLNTGGTRVVATSVIIHPGFNPNIVANDLASYRIPRVTFGLFISPIALPSGSELSSDFTDSVALASGFGVTADGQSVSLLQTMSSVNLQVISNSQCRNSYGNLIQEHHLCTSGSGGVGICDGDTGGPLALSNNNRRILIGIASFRSSAGCASGHPSAFTRITSFIQWIWSVQ